MGIHSLVGVLARLKCKARTVRRFASHQSAAHDERREARRSALEIDAMLRARFRRVRSPEFFALADLNAGTTAQ